VAYLAIRDADELLHNLSVQLCRVHPHAGHLLYCFALQHSLRVGKQAGKKKMTANMQLNKQAYRLMEMKQQDETQTVFI
jgi:hypothetical protein